MQILRNYQAPDGKIACLCRADSYDDFLSWLKRDSHANLGLREGYQGGERFTGTKSFAEAMKLAEYGWHEGLEKANKVLPQIENRLLRFIKARQPEYVVAGGTPDVGAFLASEPEHFIGYKQIDKEGCGKLARIVVNCAISCSYTAEQMITRGVAALAMVDAMEKAGISCELTVVWAVGTGKGQYEFEVPLKKHGFALEIDRIAFALAHPSFLRRLMFAASDIAGMCVGGYGMPSAAKIDKGDYYFPHSNSAYHPQDTEGLMRWVLGELKKQGVELEEENS